jgi:hypothetical protein
MLDNQLIDLVATQLESASAASGWNYIVLQKDQPTQQGTPTAPTIFFEKLFDTEHGWPALSDSYQAQSNNFSETETQVVITTFQISALVIQDPTNLSLPTASDVANYMKQYMNSRFTISTFKNQQVSILRVSEVRNPYFSDDRTMFEANPSFDLMVVHNRPISFTVDSVSTAIPSSAGVVPYSRS